MSFILYLAQVASILALIWSTFIFIVQIIGITIIIRHYSKPRQSSISSTLPPDDVPHVTIIRPVKGLEPELRACLASAFQQSYPSDKLSIRLCVASEDDPAFPILEDLVASYPSLDAQIYIEEYDPLLSSTSDEHAPSRGPNPKIRNISRAYREAKSDLIWVIDCNVWVSKGVVGRMVDKLLGLGLRGKSTPYKLVHHLPLVVDVPPVHHVDKSSVWQTRGGRLEEMFMATTHAKFYCAINTVGVAPCVVGKSTMFRKSHIDKYTDPSQNPTLHAGDADRGRGIDFFSTRICEDHLIGDLLWRAPIPGFANHGLVTGDLAIQPTAGMSVPSYWARRVRWLRVRKWTVLTATLVEPGVEAFVCNLYFAWGLTTVPGVREYLSIPPTWTAMSLIWLLSTSVWMLVDRYVHWKLQECQSVEADDNTPLFARSAGRPGGIKVRCWQEWIAAWLARESLALPIWVTAVLLGTEVVWRGQRFTVRSDMSVVAIEDKRTPPQARSNTAAAASNHSGESESKTVQVPVWDSPIKARHRTRFGVNST